MSKSTTKFTSDNLLSLEYAKYFVDMPYNLSFGEPHTLKRRNYVHTLNTNVSHGQWRDDLKCKQIVMPSHDLHEEDVEFRDEDSKDEDLLYGRTKLFFSLWNG